MAAECSVTREFGHAAEQATRIRPWMAESSLGHGAMPATSNDHGFLELKYR